MDMENNGQYSIFDDDPIRGNAADGTTQGEGVRDEQPINTENLEKLFDISAKVGLYFPLSGSAILARSRTHYNRKSDDLNKYLNASGMAQETKATVLRDYLLALAGYYNYTATPQQVFEIVEKLKPARAFIIDRYGFFRLLLSQYYRIAETIVKYVNSVREGDTEAKQRFIDTLPTENVRAAAWSIEKGVIQLLDFEGVPAQDLANFADNVRLTSEIIDYGNFYHLCKYAYNAPPEELATIRPPDSLRDYVTKGTEHPTKEVEEREIEAFVNEYCKECEQNLSKAADIYAEALETPNPDIGKWNPNGVKLSSNITAILQKPIEAHTKYVTETAPIRKYIADFTESKGNEQYKGLVTENTLQRVISGCDAMRSWGKYRNVKPIDGTYTYDISMADFAKVCGYKDAGGSDRKGLFGSLFMLSTLYFYCDRPIRLRANNENKYTTDGFLHPYELHYFSKDHTRLIIKVDANELGGELYAITPAAMKQLQSERISLPERRFIEQIKMKDHKTEEDLLDECFGYSDLLKYAEKVDKEDVKKVKANIRKSKPRDRKNLQGWFVKYHKTGFIISYTRTQNKSKEWVYKWKRETVKKNIEAIADTITDAEIVGDEQRTETATLRDEQRTTSGAAAET